MSVYKKPGSKYWWYAFVFKGRRIQKSTRVENRREAENIEKAGWTQLARGEAGIEEKPKAERKTVGKLLDALENDFKMRGKGSIKNLNLVARVKKDFETKWADTIARDDVTRYIERRRKEGAAASTVNHALQVLASAFKVAELPFPRVSKLSGKDAVRTGFFSRDELDRVSARLPDDLRDFCLFGFLVGWRKSSIAALTWNDVEDGVVRLRGKFSKNGKPYFVPIAGELAQVIDRRKEARAIKTPSGVVLTNLVFHRDGETIREFRKSWASACIAAGLGAMRCPKCEGQGKEKRCPRCKAPRQYVGKLVHDLRRSAARNFIRSGVNQPVAMRLAGWETDSIFRRYNIIDEVDLRDAMEKLTKYHKAEEQSVISITK